MIPAGVQGRLGKNRSGACALQYQSRSVALIPDQMDRPDQHEVQAGHRVAPMEQVLATLEMLLPSTQALQIWFDGSQHDRYHVAKTYHVARDSHGRALASGPTVVTGAGA
jgi:hypothetical protein